MKSEKESSVSVAFLFLEKIFQKNENIFSKSQRTCEFGL